VHGDRVKLLHKLFDGALTSTLGKVSYSNFAACFPTTAQYKPDNLKRLHQQFVAGLGAQCRVHLSHNANLCLR